MWNPEESHNWGHCTKICFHFFKVFKNSKQKFWERILLVICAVGLRAILLFNTFFILSSIHWYCVYFKNLVAGDLFCREWIHGCPIMMYCLRPVTVKGKVIARLSEGIAQLRIYFRVTVNVDSFSFAQSKKLLELSYIIYLDPVGCRWRFFGITLIIGHLTLPHIYRGSLFLKTTYCNKNKNEFDTLSSEIEQR